MEIKIRDLRDSDISEAQKIINLLIYDGMPQELKPLLQNAFKNWATYVITINTQIAGVLCVSYISHGVYELMARVILPQFRNQGLGHKLVEFAENEARSLNCTEIVRQSMKFYNKLESYTKMGYTLQDDSDDCYIFSKKIS